MLIHNNYPDTDLQTLTQNLGLVLISSFELFGYAKMVNETLPPILEHTRRVFTCSKGYGVGNLPKYLFPDFEFRGEEYNPTTSSASYHPDDVLVIGMHGPRACRQFPF